VFSVCQGWSLSIGPFPLREFFVVVAILLRFNPKTHLSLSRGISPNCEVSLLPLPELTVNCFCAFCLGLRRRWFDASRTPLCYALGLQLSPWRFYPKFVLIDVMGDFPANKLLVTSLSSRSFLGLFSMQSRLRPLRLEVWLIGPFL